MELMAVVMAGMILGYLLGCLAADLKKAARITSAAQLDDYINWAKVPEGYDWVAVDENKHIYCYRHRPDGDFSDDMWCDFAAGLPSEHYGPLPDSVLIGPLPPWRESLRRRPGSEAKTEGEAE